MSRKTIAVLADIHGNVPSMEAVVEDIRDRKVDEVLVGGDLVGRGPQGGRVVRRIAELGWPAVRGNHEDYLLAFRRREVPASWLEVEEWAASRWMAAELDPDSAERIDALPLRIRSRVDPRVVIVHGTPRSHSEGLGPWTPDAELDEHLDRIPGNVLVCAHTHRSMVRERPAGLVVNVGAVGLPFNGDVRAQYALIHVGDGPPRVELRLVDYELDAIYEIYESSGFLREGGVTAALLRLEIEHARPFLVPFLRWTAASGRPVEMTQLPDFLDFYDPQESITGFFRRIRALDRNS